METLELPTDIQTRCPTCQTVFEISESVAYSEDPRVRCGECYSIFNSHDHAIVSSLSDDLLVDDVDSDQADSLAYDSLEVDGDETIVFDSDYQHGEYPLPLNDIDLFSENANLPEMSYLEESEIPELDFDAIDSEKDQFDGTLFDDVSLECTEQQHNRDQSEGFGAKTEHAVSADAQKNIDKLEEADPIGDTFTSDIYANDSARYSFGGLWLKRIMMALVLIAVFGSLFIYANRIKYQDSPKLGSLVELVCWVTGCELSNQAKLDNLVVIRRDVYSHPKVDNALVINIVFQNIAEVEQPYPVLVISMSDLNGKVVARRDFLPNEYLNTADIGSISDIAPLETIDLSLEVMDPGDDARSFELDFK